MPLAQEGKISKCSADPVYKGNSLVPSSVTIRAYDRAEFTTTIEIW